jgi:hypothetical protein
MDKMVTVRPETHKRLFDLKSSMGFNSINDIITTLLDNVRLKDKTVSVKVLDIPMDIPEVS